MVLKAKGRKKRLKTGGSNCLPTTRTSSILKTTMFFPHLSFFLLLLLSTTDCLLGIAENSDLILFRLFFVDSEKNWLTNVISIILCFFDFSSRFDVLSPPETNEVNLMFIISTEICTCVVKIQSI